ncbi:class I SAM-dependent methyltransferase [Arthrobacter sp. BE255]|uniref:class I SAM-dependent methyltransferase n=1 Tax=Arthrobacter sp. BE255 TaxID=2817721 RepID=UPI0028555379|nr:class I SAM-dependent methyltransferase [Arthrobacter sp. BE255]MDR7158482.1 SAM-dependent methyltransferase [Arthrobacter sp. BE255]
MNHVPIRTPDDSHLHHQHPGSHDQHRVLDLDAEVFGGNLAAVLDMAGVSAARSVVDLGAGTGAGSRLLRGRYPDASLTCIDNDPEMLEVLHRQGFAVVAADLDDGLPVLAGTLNTSDAAVTAAGAPVDLVWASSSLHHLANPARLLSEVHRALAPGGVLVVAELATLPRFLKNLPGALLEQRCHAAAAAEGWNRHPDWTPVLEVAGFGVTRSEVTTNAPVTPAAREYARQWFARFLHLAALTAEDRGAVENLLEQFSDNIELEPRATRTAWIATVD